MKFVSLILIHAFISLTISSVIGSMVIAANRKEVGAIAAIGCGVGIQKGKKYSNVLTPSEVTFCLFFGAEVEKAFTQDSQ